MISDELLLKLVRLCHSVTVVLVFENLLLNNGLTELELVDAMDEVLQGDVVTVSGQTDALNGFLSQWVDLHNLFQAKHFFIPQDD